METVNSPSVPSLTLERASPLVGPRCGFHEAGRVAREHPARTPLKGAVGVAQPSVSCHSRLCSRPGVSGSVRDPVYLSQQPWRELSRSFPYHPLQRGWKIKPREVKGLAVGHTAPKLKFLTMPGPRAGEFSQSSLARCHSFPGNGDSRPIRVCFETFESCMSPKEELAGAEGVVQAPHFQNWGGSQRITPQGNAGESAG